VVIQPLRQSEVKQDVFQWMNWQLLPLNTHFQGETVKSVIDGSLMVSMELLKVVNEKRNFANVKFFEEKHL
jgi:hypothetical protein